MAFEIRLSEQAIEDLKALRPYDRRRLMDAIDQQLAHQPTTATGKRKRLDGVTADFDFEPR